ncbi:MAG: oligosaccharide flippase family protein [Acidobacteria bacterium]|nr:oligosaccharide flippase family protein [Candidatus Sulfomarinibacter sp. MAG AM1]
MITRVLRNAAWLGLGEVGVKSGLLLAAILVAHASGPSGMGTFTVAYSAALIAVLIGALGQQEVLIREVARSPGAAHGLLGASRLVQIRSARWLLPIAAVGALLVPEGSLRFTLLAFLPYAMLRTATVTYGAAFKGFDRMDVETRARGLETAVAVTAIGVIAILRWPVWTTGAAFSIGAGLGLIWIRRRKGELGSGMSTLGPSSLLSEGLPFMALAVVSQLIANADRFLLELLGVARAEIGYWGTAGIIVWAMAALPQLVSVALYPSFSRQAEAGGSPRQAGLLAGLGGAVCGLVCAGGLWILADPLVRLAFGADFAPAVPLLQRLSLALPGAFAMTVMGSVYAAWRRQRRVLWILGGALLGSLALNMMWIPSMGVLAPATVAPLVYTLTAVAMALGIVGAGTGTGKAE